MDDWKERSTSRLVLKFKAWGSFQEEVRLNPFASEASLIKQVHRGSPLGEALCDVVRAGYPIFRDTMIGQPQYADKLVSVVRWRLGRERRELDKITALVDNKAKARRL